jgi:hypothetical protein
LRRLLLPPLLVTVLAGCGAADEPPTPNTLVVVSDATLRSTQTRINHHLGRTFARYRGRATVATGPETTCVGLVGTKREFSCSTTINLESRRSGHCRATTLKQDWRGRTAPGTVATWTRDGPPRTMARTPCA